MLFATEDKYAFRIVETPDRRTVLYRPSGEALIPKKHSCIDPIRNKSQSARALGVTEEAHEDLGRSQNPKSADWINADYHASGIRITADRLDKSANPNQRRSRPEPDTSRERARNLYGTAMGPANPHVRKHPTVKTSHFLANDDPCRKPLHPLPTGIYPASRGTANSVAKD